MGKLSNNYNNFIRNLNEKQQKMIILWYIICEIFVNNILIKDTLQKKTNLNGNVKKYIN